MAAKKAVRLVGVMRDLAREKDRTGWSYAKIAAACGIAPETVYRAVRGKTDDPDPRVLAAFSVAVAAMRRAPSAARALRARLMRDATTKPAA